MTSCERVTRALRFENPDRARAMGREGRRFVEDVFTWPKVVERFGAGFER